MNPKPKMINMFQFRQVLGDDIPDLPLNRIGKFRLSQALRRKFGVQYRSVGHAKRLMDLFERHMKIHGVR